MSRRPVDVESELTTALRERSDAYARAQASLVALQERLHSGQAALHAVCPELHAVLDAIRIADEQLAPLQEEWGRLSLRPGPELAAQIQNHQAQLERTLAIVNALTAVAEADREQLAPRLDEVARGRRMQAAYAAAGRY